MSNGQTPPTLVPSPEAKAGPPPSGGNIPSDVQTSQEVKAGSTAKAADIPPKSAVQPEVTLGSSTASEPRRGALPLVVSTGSPALQAGEFLTIFVKITNPFDESITINSVIGEIPVQFVDVAAAQPRGWSFRIKSRFVKAAEKMRFVHMLPHEPNSQNSQKPVTLRPNDSSVHSFTICTETWLLFPPAPYNLPIQIDYSINNINHKTTTEYCMNIKAPFQAMICGAILGACLSFLLHDLVVTHKIENLFAAADLNSVLSQLVPIATSWIASMLGAVLVVIAFARKRDAQPFITIEDFWGGMFIGIVIGYGGTSIFQNLFSGGGTVVTPPSTP